MENILSPSILSANFANLEKDLSELRAYNIRRIHLDVMDGNFVPNITFGFGQIECLRKVSDLYFDCHLMVEEPIRLIDDFINSGVNCLTVHIEACNHVHRTVEYIKSRGIDCGIALNPGTSLNNIENILDIVDKVLIMTVNPGFGGQKFIYSMLDKISDLYNLFSLKGIDNKIIQVDGGINPSNIHEVYDAGARDIVVGSYIFNGNSMGNNIKNLISRIR